MKQQLVVFVKCVECGIQVERTHSGQITCLSNKCRQLRKTHQLGYKIKNYLKPCAGCTNTFESKHPGKKYCSVECRKKIRKILHREYTREAARKKKKTYERWVNELRKVGYVVVPPTGLSK